MLWSTRVRQVTGDIRKNGVWKSLSISCQFLKKQEIWGNENRGNSQEIPVTAANFLEGSEILQLFS